MSRVVWTQLALDDLTAIRSYIGQFNPDAAHRMTDALVRSGNRLALFPLRGRAVPGTELRELVAGRSYVMRYFIEDDAAVILRIRHASRRPTNP